MRRALVGVLMLAVAACGSDVEETSTAAEGGNVSDPFQSENLVCGSDEFGAVASGELTNVSEATYAADITVEWRDRSGEYYTGKTIRTGNIPPKVTYLWDAHPNTPEAVHPDTPEANAASCDVVDIVPVLPGSTFPNSDGTLPPISTPGAATTDTSDVTYDVPPDGN